VPAGIVAPDWAEVWYVLGAHTLEGEALIHGDYHMDDVVFDGGAVTAIVDWSSALRGPTAFDVGYCRMDLSLIFGGEAADRFLNAYESAAGQPVERLAVWDLAGAVRAYPDPAGWLPAWHEVGRSDLYPALLQQRLTDFVQSALSRL
jgi:aminoglycoside phosphotransferase (APT) family kinase protein